MITLDVSGESLYRDARAALIRFGCTTHGNDMDQRFVWLRVLGHRREDIERGLRTLRAQIPQNAAAAPPGDYQLVVVGGEGVPSRGRIVRMTT
ncbi:galactose oxidase early set domain-containing protein [Streptomyces sp. RB6PN25]|uniref:Galactose oxidase early set domain-containing protein n=1 Tax=Streptomyces humicola TaxID=2953240 RepID=A0ABT1Q3I3_9ACTN|nr:galactose oxidase early set domain-containing protein [Streptomyces humicola]MCQ4083948.1 galactose oxidase early set domain-containing protein [Streptomyces humicola]